MPKIVREDVLKNVTYLVWAPPSTLTPQGAIMKWAQKVLPQVKSKLRIFVSFPTKDNTSGLEYFDNVWELENAGKQLKKREVWLSTGFFSIVTSLNFCSSITIFGLDAGKLDCYKKFPRKQKVMFL